MLAWLKLVVANSPSCADAALMARWTADFGYGRDHLLEYNPIGELVTNFEGRHCDIVRFFAVFSEVSTTRCLITQVSSSMSRQS